VSHKTTRPTAVRSAVRALTLAGATLATGLIAGVFYVYACSVNLGLAVQPDAPYVAAMQAMVQRLWFSGASNSMMELVKKGQPPKASMKGSV
jgi:hypothetical protein